MASVVGSILRAATRQDNEPFNCISYPVHERWQTGLSGTNAIFYLYFYEGVKSWNTIYAPLPPNHIMLNKELGVNQLPLEIDFNFVLSQHRFGQFQFSQGLARTLHLPHLCIEHTQPLPQWPKAKLDAIKTMKADINIFISEWSRKAWGWADDEAIVIHHGVDTDLFKPNKWVDKKKHILSVVNDFKNRDVFCGFKLYVEATGGLPVNPVGDTPGLSKPAASVPDLVHNFQEAGVFINTSLVSPIPTALLEAMATGNACVSTSNCMIPEIIEHGHNGLLSNEPAQLRQYCELLLNDRKLAEELGANARKTILERFSMANFVRKWDEVFQQAAGLVYTGN